MAQAKVNGISIEYEVSGPTAGSPILLIHGVGAQLVRWPPELISGLAAAGFRVIRFDNRDAGLSTHMHGAPVPDYAAIMAARSRGEPVVLPYTISDMAKDAACLLDALDIPAAHIVGVSLGGMVAQLLAIEHPTRVRSLAILMSHAGDPSLAPADPALTRMLAAPAPDPAQDLEAYLQHSIALNVALAGPGYPTDAAVLRDYAVQAAARAYDPPGAGRQLAAARGAPDRTAALQTLCLPALVIHGAADRLIPPEAGEHLARSLKAAWRLIINGMGHDIPHQLCPLFATVITANTQRA